MKKLLVFLIFACSIQNICIASCIIPNQCEDDSDCQKGKTCQLVWNNQAACNYKKCMPKGSFTTY